ncbi:MAG: SAM-dependent methyltransferase, partial [Vulcanococcus sp.]
ELPQLLSRREALLRLVDPITLGDFRWVALARGEGVGALPAPAPLPLFLQDPPIG